ncbi:MAG TPA: ABC transporter ATP-binding protein [Acidimicrobiia bacterium]|nr:ABC transporter ATP-binding protein [Acidimicrobiia bacterium]
MRGESLQVSDLDVWRGEAHILHGVDFDIAPGRVTALLGRNGVGKTTTLLAVMGLLRAEGSIRFGETELIGMPTHLVARRGIAYVPEDREVFTMLTVAENLRLAERPGGDHRYDLVYELFPDLAIRKEQTAGTLSGGQQQMLAIGRALLDETSLLLVDEPTKGLAPIVIDDVVAALQTASGDTTVLLVEQNLAVARRLASEAIVLDEGAVVYAGDLETLASDAALTGRYLGVEVR